MASIIDSIAASCGQTAGLIKEYLSEQGSSHQSRTATLTVAGWGTGTTQKVSVDGVTASSNIVVSPAPDSTEAWGKAGVYASAQGAGTVTFACKKAPSAELTANILICS